MKRRMFWLAAAAAMWLTGVPTAAWALWHFSSTPGVADTAPDTWPTNITIGRNPAGPTLVMLIHPKCQCTRASLAELARLEPRLPNVQMHLLVVAPTSEGEEFLTGPTMGMVRSFASAQMHLDPDGVLATRFGAHTSGTVLLYDANGRLRFNGGVTSARGHEGPSRAQTDLVAAAEGLDPAAPASNHAVFGCGLQDTSESAGAIAGKESP